MLDFNLKAKNIKRKLLNTHKRNEELERPQNHSQFLLPGRDVTAASPSLKGLLLKETELKAREDALEQEKLRFQRERTAWTTNMTAQKKKQTQIRRGATIMFRMHRLEAQQEREEQEKRTDALENGLLQTAQQELDFIHQEHTKVIGNLLAATVSQLSYAAVSLNANARANTISDRLTDVLDTVHYERLHVMDLTEKVHVKSAELDVLVAHAKAEHIKTQESFKIARSLISRFSLAAEAIGIVQGQIESNAIEDRERLSKTIDKERGNALEEARNETQKRLAALRDARTAFEKLREAEKANLAKGYARVEHSRAIVDMEKELVKKEMVRARLLAIKAEQERAASVDAKKTALEELQAARLMRDESRRALHKLVAIADEMAISKATSDKLTETLTSPEAGGNKNLKTELSEGLMSRFGYYIGNRRTSSQGQINGTNSGVSEIEGGKTGGLQKRCTSLNITHGGRLCSPTPSAVSRPQFQPYGSPHNTAESYTGSTETSSSTDAVDVTPLITQIHSQDESINADTKDSIPIENGHDVSPLLKLPTEKYDKQTSRMKLRNIGNTTYQMNSIADKGQIGVDITMQYPTHTF